MERRPALSRPLLTTLRATLLLVTLLLGGAFHFVHHLQDPECGTGSDRTNHVCTACSGLHGSTLVAAATQAPMPSVVIREQEPPASVASPVVEARRQASPRAPPAS